MQKLQSFSFIDNHIGGKQEMIEPFIKQVLEHPDVWQKFLIERQYTLETFVDRNNQQGQQVLSALVELTKEIEQLPNDVLLKNKIIKKTIIDWLNGLTVGAKYKQYVNNQFLMYKCELDDGKIYYINCGQVLAIIYTLLTKKFGKEKAAEVIADALQPYDDKDTDCPTGKAYSTILFYNFTVNSEIPVFEPLTESNAQDMFKVLVERSEICYGGIIPHPEEDIALDSNSTTTKQFFVSQKAITIDHILLNKEKRELEIGSSKEYVELLKKYFAITTNSYLEFFYRIIDFQPWPDQRLTDENILSTVYELSSELSSDEVESLFAATDIVSQIKRLIEQEKTFLTNKFVGISSQDLGMLLLAETIFYSGKHRNIREYLDRLSIEDKKTLFGLQDDDNLEKAASLAEDLRTLNDRLYKIIPNKLRLPNGSRQNILTGLYEVDGIPLRSSKEFLQICWALFNESILDNNPNKFNMRALQLGEEEGQITLGEMLSSSDEHFGNISPDDVRSANKLLLIFRMWFLNGKKGKCPCESLNDSEISLLERWGAANFKKVKLGVKEERKEQDKKQLIEQFFDNIAKDMIKELRDAKTIRELDKIYKNDTEKSTEHQQAMDRKYPEMKLVIIDTVSKIMAMLARTKIETEEKIHKQIEEEIEHFRLMLVTFREELERAVTVVELDKMYLKHLVKLTERQKSIFQKYNNADTLDRLEIIVKSFTDNKKSIEDEIEKQLKIEVEQFKIMAATFSEELRKVDTLSKL